MIKGQYVKNVIWTLEEYINIDILQVIWNVESFTHCFYIIYFMKKVSTTSGHILISNRNLDSLLKLIFNIPAINQIDWTFIMSIYWMSELFICNKEVATGCYQFSWNEAQHMAQIVWTNITAVTIVYAAVAVNSKDDTSPLF